VDYRIDEFFVQDVTTRGSYYPDKSMATAAVSVGGYLETNPNLTSRQNPPLYLHVTSTTKEGLEQAVAKIEELMKQELPALVDERRFRRRDQEQQPPVERDELGRVSCPYLHKCSISWLMRAAQMARSENPHQPGLCPGFQLACPGCWSWRSLCEAYPAGNRLPSPDQRARLGLPGGIDQPRERRGHVPARSVSRCSPGMLADTGLD